MKVPWVLIGIVVLVVPIFALVRRAANSPRATPKKQEIPKLVHFTYSGPLRPYLLTTIDASLKAMPDAEIWLHLLIPENAPNDFKKYITGVNHYQLEPLFNILKESGNEWRLKLIYHDDPLASLVKGSPLEGIGLKNRHLGGFWTKQEENDALAIVTHSDRSAPFFHGESSGVAHSSDVARVLTVYKHGGMWVDSDVYAFKNLLSIANAYGSLLVCENDREVKANLGCKVVNAFMAFPPRHPFMAEVLRVIQRRIWEFSPEGVFPGSDPNVPIPQKRLWWTGVGPAAFTLVHRRWALRGWSRRVTVRPHELLSAATHLPAYQEMSDGFQIEEGDPIESVGPEAYVTIFGREYFSPTHWSKSEASQNMTLEIAEQFAHIYSLHLWDDAGELGKPRPKLIEYLRNKPETVVAYTHRVTCIAYCDVDVLQERGNASHIFERFPKGSL